MQTTRIRAFRVFLCLFIGLCTCLSITNCHKQTNCQEDKVVVAYITAWARNLPDPTLMTHLNYAFGKVTRTFDGVKIQNEEFLKQVVALKQQAPELKVMLSIGGWTAGGFSPMAADPVKRAAFVQDCARIANEFALDGIDMDWEYPTSSAAGIESDPSDTDNFTALMKELRAALGPDRLLTLASVADGKYVDFKAINPYIDFVNVMHYDVSRPPYHHAALYRSSLSGRITAQEAIDAHRAAGVPDNKLVLGLPFYGHAAPPMPDFVDYKNIESLKHLTPAWDDTAKAPYMVDSTGRLAFTYETPQSIAYKAQYIKDQNLRGAMYWEYHCDDSLQTLTRAVWESIHACASCKSTSH